MPLNDLDRSSQKISNSNLNTPNSRKKKLTG